MQGPEATTIIILNDVQLQGMSWDQWFLIDCSSSVRRHHHDGRNVIRCLLMPYLYLALASPKKIDTSNPNKIVMMNGTVSIFGRCQTYDLKRLRLAQQSSTDPTAPSPPLVLKTSGGLTSIVSPYLG